MVGIVKTIDGVKKIVPLDKTLAPAMDIVPDNTIMKFSNATNSLVDTGWCALTSHNGRIKSLVPSTYRKFNIGYGTTFAEEVFNCERSQLVVGNSNTVRGEGWHYIIGINNISNAVLDSTVFQFGGSNTTVCRMSGLGMQIGVSNCSTSIADSSVMIGLANCDTGLHDLPAECVACTGISANHIFGQGNHVRSSWSSVIGLNNAVDCWASINTYCYDPVTCCYQCTVNTKVVGSIYVLGNSNGLCGAGIVSAGNGNIASFALNSIAMGVDNKIYGRTEAGFKYNQIAIGVANISCGFDNIAIGASNCMYGTNQIKLGSYGTMVPGAGGAIAIGHGANALYCNGFTASEIKSGGIGATIPGGAATPGYNQGNEVIGGMHIISGQGTLAQLSEAMTVFGHTGRNFSGYIHFYDAGAICAHISSRYDGGTRDDYITNPVICDGTMSIPYNDWNQWHVSGRDFWSDIFMTPSVTNLAAFANCHVRVSIRVVW